MFVVIFLILIAFLLFGGYLGGLIDKDTLQALGWIITIVGVIAAILLFERPDRMTIENILAIFSTTPPAQLPIPPTTTPIPPTTVPPTPSPSATPVVEDGMVQVYVPAGNFVMGSRDDDAHDNEKPEQTVYLDAYWIDQTEVTNEMYRACVEADVCRPPEVNKSHTRESYYDNAQYKNYPVIYVQWDDATTYCQWAGRRLATEAEWEKAARGTDGRKYPWGDEAPTDGLANFCDSNCPADWKKDESVDDGYTDTSPVGNYPAGASPYGAFDMAANVSEWVNDFQLEYGAVRGGSWVDQVQDLRVSRRGWSFHMGSPFRGFRCAASDS